MVLVDAGPLQWLAQGVREHEVVGRVPFARDDPINLLPVPMPP